MWERFKFWMSGYKNYTGCCLGCSFFEECKSEVVYERDVQEANERDLLIADIIRERMPESFKKSA